LPNNTQFVSVNSTGTGTINLIKGNASDIPEIPYGAVLSATTAPSTDLQIPQKKYVDDAIAAGTAANSVLLNGEAASTYRLKGIKNYGTSLSASSSVSLGDLYICYGKQNITANTTVTITNLPFTSAATYVGFLIPDDTNTTQLSAGQFSPQSGSQAKITNAYGSDKSWQWVAIGT
jgi:hypothetical protein